MKKNIAIINLGLGNIFHFTENAYPRIKSFLSEKRSDIRKIKSCQE